MDQPVTELRAQIEEMESSYEFLISFAGQGVGREAVQSSTDQIREFVTGFEESLDAAVDAALAVPEEHDELDTEAYLTFVEDLSAEVEEARNVLVLLGQQDRITSAQVDNMNGMSVFQSVVMKLFFLDELTDHLERNSGDEDE
ncbi:hypothetical protein JCM30237_30650 [Halolamina litorea]|uniref:Ferritin-like metal-binding protein YciE n=1 Tax=Halolamina litorea TaxID=1515593 RepID=A0ABD6BMV7_9EURY|nr:hypothetical protein [Halolamina litorea]